MNAERTDAASMRTRETAGRRIFSPSNTTSRWINGTRVLGLIIVGLCALRTKFDSVLLKESKGRNPSSSRAQPKGSTVVSAPTLLATPALRLPASSPRGRRVAL